MKIDAIYLFSFGAFNNKGEGEKVVEELKSTVTMLKNISTLVKKAKKA